MAKRSFLDFATGSCPNITIITADGGRIPAHAEVLRLVCSCMKNAPAADTWDLTHLQIDGKPPSAEIVTLVIEVVYDNMHVIDFQMDKSAGRFSMAQLCDMLLFADAVGCSKSFLESMASMLGGCASNSIVASLPVSANVSSTAEDGAEGSVTAEAVAAATETTHVDIHIDKYHRTDVLCPGAWLCSYDSGASHTLLSGVPDAAMQQLRKTVAEHLEKLLYTAFKLELPQLRNAALWFVQNHTRGGSEGAPQLLSIKAVKDSLFTPRVMSAASTGGGRDMILQACTQQRMGIGIGEGTMFSDVEMKGESSIFSSVSNEKIEFTARLKKAVHGCQPGTEVKVVLSLKVVVVVVVLHGRWSSATSGETSRIPASSDRSPLGRLHSQQSPGHRSTRLTHGTH